MARGRESERRVVGVRMDDDDDDGGELELSDGENDSIKKGPRVCFR